MITVVLVMSCFSGCSDDRKMTTDDFESNEGVSLDGYCIRGSDGMMVICGDGAEQRVYVLIGDESGKDIMKSVKDGDHVRLTADIYTDMFPINTVVKDGEIIDGDNAVFMNENLFNELTALGFMAESVAGEDGFVVVEEYDYAGQ